MTDQETPRRLDPQHSIDGDLTNRFTYHAPTPEQPEVYQLVRDLAHLLALVIESATFPGPERSLATVKAEEAVMWANAGIARRGLTDAAYAGARDLVDTALQSLHDAKPASVVVDVLDPPTPETVADERLRLARNALVATGYFTADQVGDDVAPRITEMASALRGKDKDQPSYDPWADGPATFHEGKVDPDAFMPLVVSLNAHDGLLVRNPEVLNGRGVLVLPDGIGIEWRDVVAAFGTTPPGPTPPGGPGTFTAVCPHCPELISTEGQGAQRDAQEWLVDHLAQQHGAKA